MSWTPNSNASHTSLKKQQYSSGTAAIMVTLIATRALLFFSSTLRDQCFDDLYIDGAESKSLYYDLVLVHCKSCSLYLLFSLSFSGTVCLSGLVSPSHRIV